ncbi:MAG: type II toxin-antitoxin system HicA family toxin [Dehalococcoidia bacterium]|nr:type II toxin-antitoxin system HicA family toxin [Dehalococcoidia bacterium]
MFEAFGCQFVRERGDHIIYEHPGARRPVVIPRYNEVPVTIILNNMRTVGMSRDQYFELLASL